MTLPADPPRLPKWPFFVGDASLLGLAWMIASRSPNPFVPGPLIAIVACVVVGAVLATYPFVIEYTRAQEAALDDRQRSLEVLSRTVATSAEQVSIAANGLHEITELAQRTLRTAESLPQKLQDKTSTLLARFDTTWADEREELEKELTRLRTAEGDRLEAAIDKIARTLAELARLEATVQQHLAACAETIVKASATPTALAISAHPDPVAPAIGTSIEPLKEFAGAPVPEVGPLVPTTDERPVPVLPQPKADVVAAVSIDLEPMPAYTITEISSVAPRDARSSSPIPVAEAGEPKSERKRGPRKPKSVPVSGQPPAPTENSHLPSVPAEASDVVSRTLSSSAEIATEAIAPVKLDREIPEPKSDEQVLPEESSLSSDGVTRLLVTAYIGIGNRLFIRGEGPGLSWEKGLPLQFVSIGKWRWETSDSPPRVSFKLYKNDTVECTALGLQTIDAGRQHEVSATF
jgi:hypothetical protein